MGFINSALMWGMGAISIPIIIHLLNRRRFKVVKWAAMELLLQANKKNRRRVRLEHLLVLLLRCLAMALIVMAIARPVASSGALLQLPGVSDPVERIVLLDDSGSMGHRTGRTSCFDRAKMHVKRLVEGLRAERGGDWLTAVRASRPEMPDVLLTQLGTDRVDAYLRQLEQAQPVPSTFDAPRAVEACVKRFSAANTGGPSQRVVYIVTDLRASDWLGSAGERPKLLADALRAAPRDTRVLVVDIGTDEVRNLGITRVEPVEKLAMVGLPLELSVRVANRGPQPVFDVPLVLETGDARVPLAPIARIDAGQEAEVRHRYAFGKAGVHALSVRLPDDALALDDVRHLALEVREALKVLVVEGEEGARPIDGEAGLLRLALAPPGEVQTGVDAQIVPPDALRTADLGAYDSVIATNLEAWPAEKLSDLRRWVERGGGLALFLGDLLDETAWTRDLWANGGGLLPVPLGPRVEAPTDEEAPGLAAPTDDHPLSNVFKGERNPFLKRVRARVRRQLPRPKEGTARILLQLADPAGTPFVIERAVGEGRVLLFNTTADAAWSTWPRDPSYPVTMQEVVRLLAPPAVAGRNLTAGQPLERPVNPARYWPRAYVTAPKDLAPSELHAEPRQGSEALWVRVADTRKAGVWTLRLDSRQAEPALVELVAVNPDATEGDLARADAARLRGLEGVHLEVITAGETTDLLAVSDGTKKELWKFLLLALLVALALEQALAWRAAHHASTAESQTTEMARAPAPAGAAA